MDKLLNRFSVAVIKLAVSAQQEGDVVQDEEHMVSDLKINVKDYDYKSDKPLAYTADVYLINYDGHEMVAKVFTLRMLSTVERVKKLRAFKKVRTVSVERRVLLFMF